MGFLGLDYADGDNVPLWVTQSLGGRDLAGSLGSRVRGYPGDSYDSSFKIVGNIEARLLGPACFGQDWLIPALYAFFDAGYYAGFANCAVANSDAGLIMSTGGGFNVSVLDFIYVGVCAGIKLHSGSDLYDTYLPDGKDFFWDDQDLLPYLGISIDET